jgi:Ca-activated chloride channel family protein
VSALGSWLPAGIVGFSAPVWLAILIPVAALMLGASLRRRPAALPWPALPEARAAGARRIDALRLCSLLLRAGAALALIAAIAEPVERGGEARERHDGLDLVLVVDSSGSMRALDAEGERGPRTRLELAREVVSRFARSRVAEGDRVGLVVFGESAFTQCPLTSDGNLLAAALARVEAGVAGESTALGDALALAVKRVIGADEPALPGDPREPVEGKPPVRSPRPSKPAEGEMGPSAGRLVVLLTDGRSNAGSVPTDVAAALAAFHRIRVHTVGIGSRGEVAMAGGARGRELDFERHDLDSAALEEIAGATGGRFFHALSSGDLRSVYDEIDQLERVPRTAPPRLAGAPAPEPFLAIAGGLVLLEILALRVLWRGIP